MIKPVFLHDWQRDDVEDSIQAMIADFQISQEALEGATILLASYTYEDYSGDAYVLYLKDDKLFEVHGGHCSCYGLEGQWEPSEVTIPELKAQLDRYKPSYYGDELRELVLTLSEQAPGHTDLMVSPEEADRFLEDNSLPEDTATLHKIMGELWPVLGGSHMDAETWQEVSQAVQKGLTSHA